MAATDIGDSISTPSLLAAQASTLKGVQELAGIIIASNAAMAQRLVDFVFANPYGLNPMDAAAALGNAGSSLVNGWFNPLIQYLTARRPASVPSGVPAGFTVTTPANGNLVVVDSGKPTVAAGAIPDVTTANQVVSITVTITDNVAVDLTTVLVGNLVVTGPAGTIATASVSVSGGGLRSPVTAVYTLTTPAGGWTNAANGKYTATMNGVKDAPAGNTMAQATASFNVALP